jgi:hypothetical protein
MSFTTPIFRKLTYAKRQYVEIFCTDFNPFQFGNIESADRNLFTFYAQSVTVAAAIFTKLTLAGKLFLHNYRIS